MQLKRHSSSNLAIHRTRLALVSNRLCGIRCLFPVFIILTVVGCVLHLHNYESIFTFLPLSKVLPVVAPIFNSESAISDSCTSFSTSMLYNIKTSLNVYYSADQWFHMTENMIVQLSFLNSKKRLSNHSVIYYNFDQGMLCIVTMRILCKRFTYYTII